MGQRFQKTRAKRGCMGCQGRATQAQAAVRVFTRKAQLAAARNGFESIHSWLFSSSPTKKKHRTKLLSESLCSRQVYPAHKAVPLSRSRSQSTDGTLSKPPFAVIKNTKSPTRTRTRRAKPRPATSSDRPSQASRIVLALNCDVRFASTRHCSWSLVTRSLPASRSSPILDPILSLVV